LPSWLKAIAIVALGSSAIVWPRGASAASIADQQIPTANSGSTYITLGPDGYIWFAEAYGQRVARLDRNGRIEEFPLPFEGTPVGITAGPDGNIWFTEQDRSSVGTITHYGIFGPEIRLSPGTAPFDITTGPDGNLWATAYPNVIARITPSGQVTEFVAGGNPIGITSGPDGNLWFARLDDTICRISPTGTLTEFPLRPGASPVFITSGPDGNMWFTEEYGDAIGRISMTGEVMEFPLPPGSLPLDITTGPHGFMWFTEWGTNRIARIGPTGVVIEVDTPTPFGRPRGIARGLGVSLFFVEAEANRIGFATAT
jgi:streptogramin lyase